MKSVLAFCAALAAAGPALAQPLDGYMKIDGVRGEVTAKPHNKWIQITGISKLPEGCRGDEGGGSLTVRVAKMPDMKTVPQLGGFEDGFVDFDLIDEHGERLHMTLERTLVSNTFSGAGHHPIQIGYTTAEGAPTDQSDLMTLNFRRVTWERPNCEKRTVAAR